MPKTISFFKLPRTRRWLAIISWALIAAAYLAFFLVDLRLDFTQLQVPCSGGECNYLAISQAEVDALEIRGLTPRTYSLALNGATVLAVAASWTLGVMILWRQGSSRIGWSVSLALIVMPVALISDADNLAANYPGLQIPSVLLSLLGTFILLLFLYLFPNGRFYPRGASLVFTATFLGFVVFNLELIDGGQTLAWIPQIGFPVLMGLLFLACGFQILRYRKGSTSLERQQTKWILLGIVLLMLGFPIWFLFLGGGLEIPSGLPRLLASMGGWIASLVAISALPVAIFIAITRHRLWDIDLVVRRTLQYTTLTGLLALTYFGAVVILQSILSPLTSETNSPLVIVISTLIIAALFNPLRNRVQDFIDRRFYRQKYDAEQALAQFAATARDEVDMEKLNAALLGVVEETMQPERKSLWIRQ